jgi:hypothetical protein
MRPRSKVLFEGRSSLTLSRSGLSRNYTNAAEQEIGIGQQQYREWQDERNALAEMIGEAEYNLEPARGHGGSLREAIPPSVRATYARVARVEQLMARHPEWRPKS